MLCFRKVRQSKANCDAGGKSLKSSGWQKVVEKMESKFGLPINNKQCRNKFSKLKEDYKISKLMRESSGFGADGLPHNEKVWEDFVKKHPKAQKLAEEPFPSL